METGGLEFKVVGPWYISVLFTSIYFTTLRYFLYLRVYVRKLGVGW